MSSNQQYKSIKELAEAIQNGIEALENGSIDEADLQSTLDDVRSLYDRLVVIQYKAFESKVKADEVQNSTKNELSNPRVDDVLEPEEPKSEEQPKSNEGLFSGFKLDLGDQSSSNDLKEKPKVKAKAKTVSGKQESIPMPDQPLPFNNPNPPIKVDKPVERVEEEIVEVVDENQTNLIDEIDAKPYTEAPSPINNEEPVKSLNEQLAANQSGDNLANKLAMQPIENLKAAIGINQKFLFMNDLFNGEHGNFHAAIDRIDSMNDWGEAKSYLGELGQQFTWDPENESVLNFSVLVERRFL